MNVQIHKIQKKFNIDIKTIILQAYQKAIMSFQNIMAKERYTYKIIAITVTITIVVATTIKTILLCY